MRLFQRFSRRFSLERWVYSAAAGIAALLLFADMLLVFRLLRWQISPAVSAVFLVLPCAAVMTAIHLFWPVREREQARRLDALGLEERAVTALQYQGGQSNMVLLQREDTKRHLEGLSPEQVSMHWPKTLLIIACVLLAGGIALGLNLKALEAKPVESDPLEQLLRKKVQELEQLIQGSQLSEEEARKLMEMLSQLSEENELKRAEELKKIEEELETALLTEGKENSLAVLLLRYSETRLLGQAILNLDADAAVNALDEMELLCIPKRRSIDRAQTLALINVLDRISLEMELKTFAVQDMNLHRLLAHLSVELEEALAQDDQMAISAIRQEFALMKKLMADLLSGDEEGRIAFRQEDDSEGRGQSETGESVEKAVTGYRTGGGSQGAGFGSGQTEKQRASVPIFEPALDPEWNADYSPGMVNQDGALQRKVVRNDYSPAVVPYDRVFGAYYAAYLEEEIDEDLLDAAFAYFEGL